MTEEPRGGWPRWGPILWIAVLALLPFTPALGNGFPFDDTLASQTTRDGAPNPVLRELHPPWHYFGLQYWAGGERSSRLYRPVTILSYAWTHHFLAQPLFGPDHQAFPHHALNLLLNFWAGLLVFRLLGRFGVGRLGATLVAGLFAVHALHSEVVAGIVGRAELFSFCFGAAALAVLLRQGSARGVGRSALAGVLLFLALCSKESALAWVPFLPCALAAAAWSRGEAAGPVLRERAWCLVGAAVPAVIGFFWLRGLAIHGFEEDVFYAANPLYYESTATRLLTAVKVQGYALYKCLAPFSLASIYGPPTFSLVAGLADPGFLFAAVVLLAWLVAGLWRPSRSPLLFLSVAIFFGFSFLTSNLPFAIGTVFGERLYFIPSLGVCLLPALILPRLGPVGRRGLFLVCGLWVVGCVVVDIQRSLAWRDNQTLMITDAAAQPRCASLQVKAANLHRWLGSQDPARKAEHQAEAWRLLRLARSLDPKYVSAMESEARFLREDGDPDGALVVLRQALDAKRLPISGFEAEICAQFALLTVDRPGGLQPALEHLRRAVALRPQAPPYRQMLLDRGIGVLPREVVEPVLAEGLRRFPRDVMMQVLQAAFIEAYGDGSRGNAEHIAGILDRVFRSVPASAMAHPRFRLARIHRGEARLLLGQTAAAKADFEAALRVEQATAEQRARAQRGLDTIAGRRR